MTPSDRHARARAVLAAAGLPHATVRAAGHDQSVAVLGNLPPDTAPILARLAPELRAAGFRYITIELGESGRG